MCSMTLLVQKQNTMYCIGVYLHVYKKVSKDIHQTVKSGYSCRVRLKTVKRFYFLFHIFVLIAYLITKLPFVIF